MSDRPAEPINVVNSNDLFSAESERAFLTILLDNPDKLFDVEDIRPEMFSSRSTQTLFSVMNELANSGLVPTRHLIEEHLKRTNALDTVGGIEYLKYLESLSYEEQNLRKYQENIKDSYIGRILLTINSKLPGMVKTTGDIGQVIHYVRSSLDDLASTTGGDKTKKLGTVLSSAWGEIKQRIESPGLRGFPTGFESLNSLSGGITPGDLWIIAARPSHGKTSLACNSLYEVSINHGLTPLIFSKEMNTQSLVERLASIDSGVPLHNIRIGALSQEEIGKLTASFSRLEEVEIFIDSNFSSDLSYIISTIRKFHRIHGVNVVYIDYAQLMAERSANSTHELGKISRALKLLANELGIGVYLLSQLNRLVESRDDKRPILSDLRQSGNLEEDADVVLMLYRDELYSRDSEYKGLIQAIFRKNRNGPIGSVFMKFDKETTKIEDN